VLYVNFISFNDFFPIQFIHSIRLQATSGYLEQFQLQVTTFSKKGNAKTASELRSLKLAESKQKGKASRGSKSLPSICDQNFCRNFFRLKSKAKWIKTNSAQLRLIPLSHTSILIGCDYRQRFKRRM
jgi:hypothetical protein